MRRVLVVVMIAACSKGPTSAAPGSNAQAGSASVPSTMAMKSVTLLEPADVVEARLSGVEAFGNLVKGVAESVGRYDAAHAGSVPGQVDAVVVVRTNGTRVWLVGPAGDVAAPGLDADIAKLAPVPVKERQVAAIVHMARDGVAPNEEVKLPASWAAAAGSGGSDIDSVIDKVWPRKE